MASSSISHQPHDEGEDSNRENREATSGPTPADAGADEDALRCAVCDVSTSTRELRPAVPTLLSKVLIPTDDGYARKDIVLADGIIAHIGEPGSGAEVAGAAAEAVDCTERLLLPGFVNAHTHSIEHWARGLIKPLPLELAMFRSLEEGQGHR